MPSWDDFSDDDLHFWMPMTVDDEIVDDEYWDERRRQAEEFFRGEDIAAGDPPPEMTRRCAVQPLTAADNPIF